MNKILLSTLAVVGLIIGLTLGFVLDKPSTVIRETVKEVPVTGALAGPDISSPYISVGGLPIYAYKGDWKSASSTPCSFKAEADIKLLTFTAGPTTATTSLTFWLATSTTQTGTTTQITYRTLPGSAGNYFTWSAASATTTVENPPMNGLVNKNDWVNFGLQKGSGDSYSGGVGTAGVCSYIYQVVE